MKKRTIICMTMAACLLAFWSGADAAQKLAKEQILNIAFDAGDLKTLDQPTALLTTSDSSLSAPLAVTARTAAPRYSRVRGALRATRCACEPPPTTCRV